MAMVSFQQCPRCQSPIEQGISICPQCGVNLPGDPAPAEHSVPLSQPLPESSSAPAAPSEFFAAPEAANIPAAWSAPGQAPASGIFPPPAPPVLVKPRRGRKVALILLAVALAVILGTGGSLAYILTRPKPVIQVKSDYQVDSTLVGSTGTSFRISGQDFSGNANILFLLDSQPAPGARMGVSDGKGNFQTDLEVTPDWKVGSHMLTAKDDKDYITKTAIPVKIVEQGVAGTPGPNGSPADNASFSLTVAVSATYSNGTPRNVQWPLNITGNPDPAGGKVCAPDDDGQPRTYKKSFGSSDPYTETLTLTCTGTYQHGHLTYVETVLSDVYKLSGGVRCASTQPQAVVSIEGDFSSPTQISGTYKRVYTQIDCSDGSYIYWMSATGTWEGSF